MDAIVKSTDKIIKVQAITSVSKRQTLFINLDDIYPECKFLLNKEQHLYPFLCLKQNVCPKNKNCVGKLIVRLKYVFDQFPQADIVNLWYKYFDMPNSTRAGVFDKYFQDVRLITFNRTEWVSIQNRFKNGEERHDTYELTIPASIFLQEV